jgi:hypothetical protein
VRHAKDFNVTRNAQLQFATLLHDRRPPGLLASVLAPSLSVIRLRQERAYPRNACSLEVSGSRPWVRRSASFHEPYRGRNSQPIIQTRVEVWIAQALSYRVYSRRGHVTRSNSYLDACWRLGGGTKHIKVASLTHLKKSLSPTSISHLQNIHLITTSSPYQ